MSKVRDDLTTLSTFKKTVSTILWPLICVVSVLFLAVMSILTFSMGQNESSMTRILIGKGSALIHAVEASVRINMRRRSPLQLQAALQELVNADVRFVSITLNDGTILAHNEIYRIGSMLEINGQEVQENFLDSISKAVENSTLRWVIAEVDGKKTFVIYRNFMPARVRKNRANVLDKSFEFRPPSERDVKRRKKDRPLRPKKQIPPASIILGLDITPFEISQKQDRIYLFSLAAGIVLVGATLLLALYYALHARESRRKQNLAEGQVRDLEEEMLRKDKLAAIGNLAAGVAHEIRNPLSSIKGYATYLGQRFAEGSEDRQAATIMVREVDRLNRVITDLIGLSRPTDVHAVPMDILPVLEHSLNLLRQDAEKKQVTFSLRRPKRTLAQVLIDTDRFGQALLNICLNALDAMPNGGILSINPTVFNQKFLAVDISDTGYGIEESHLAHIFDPYFTTKGHGTGLGLATVHKIIEAHGGEIFVTSQHNSNDKDVLNENVKGQDEKFGTTFRILLPFA